MDELLAELKARIEALEKNQVLLVQHAISVRFNGASIALPDELEQLING